MNPRPGRALGYLLGSAFLYASFLIGATWSDAYMSGYGTFLLSRGELAFKLNLLVFILPVALLLGAAGGELLPDRLGRWFDALGERPPGRITTLAVAAIVLAVVMLVRVYVLRESVVTDDENVYHFQAQILASGRLYADSLPEPIRPFFDNQFVVNNGRWYGLYFFGHPLVLAAFLKLGLVQWVGALEAAITLLLAVGIARRVFTERTAVLTRGLLALSPFFIFVSATHLSQPTSMVLLALFVYAALRVEASPRATTWWALASAALVGAVFTRPQTGVFLSLPFLLRIAWLMLRGGLRPGWLPPAVAIVILGVGAAAFLRVNHALTGSVLHTGYQAYMAQGHTWLFPFGLFYSVREISQSLAQLNFWLLGWPISLAFVVFFQRTPQAWALASMPLIAFAWYGLVAVPTVNAVGPVYYAETIVPLVILTASGLERLIVLARERLGEIRLTRALIAAPLAGALVSLLAFVPFEVASLRLMADVTQAPYDLVESRGLNHALVFVRSLPALSVVPGSWAYYHRNNSPDLRDQVLFVRDLGAEKNKELMRYLPDRTPYLMGMADRDLVLLPLER
jgi:hypothetical protein